MLWRKYNDASCHLCRKHFPFPCLTSPSSRILRQPSQSLVTYDIHVTDEETEAQRWETTCSRSYSQEATELCFECVFKCAFIFEGKMTPGQERLCCRDKPAHLSPTLSESCSGGRHRVQRQRVCLPAFANVREDSVFSPGNSVLPGRVLNSSFTSQVLSLVSSLSHQRPPGLHQGQSDPPKGR